MSDTRKRSLLKAVLYRAIATVALFLIVWLFTKKLSLALGIGVAEALFKIAFYFAYERVWNKIKWGKCNG